jgi:hypothetical protein
MRGIPDACQPRYPGIADYLPVWQPARATTAAPFVFKAVEIDEKTYEDGAFGCNNPSTEAYWEVVKKNGYQAGFIKLCVSIGTGKAQGGKDYAMRPGIVNILRRIKSAKAKVLDCENTHHQMEALMLAAKKPYVRLNAGVNVGITPLDEWSTKRKDGLTTLKYLERETNIDLGNEDMQRRIKELASQLVQHRRERAKDATRWKRFTQCTSFPCSLCNTGNLLPLPRDLKAHLKNNHPEFHHQQRRQLDAYVQRCETQPRIPGGPF